MNDPHAREVSSDVCKHCMLAIPVGARVCANCGHNQHAFSRVSIHFGLVGLLAAIAALGIAFWQAAVSQETLNQAKLETLKAEDAAGRAEQALIRIEEVAAQSEETDRMLMEVIRILVED